MVRAKGFEKFPQYHFQQLRKLAILDRGLFYHCICLAIFCDAVLGHSCVRLHLCHMCCVPQSFLVECWADGAPQGKATSPAPLSPHHLRSRSCSRGHRSVALKDILLGSIWKARQTVALGVDWPHSRMTAPESLAWAGRGRRQGTEHRTQRPGSL